MFVKCLAYNLVHRSDYAISSVDINFTSQSLVMRVGSVTTVYRRIQAQTLYFHRWLDNRSKCSAECRILSNSGAGLRIPGGCSLGNFSFSRNVRKFSPASVCVCVCVCVCANLTRFITGWTSAAPCRMGATKEVGKETLFCLVYGMAGGLFILWLSQLS